MKSGTGVVIGAIAIVALGAALASCGSKEDASITSTPASAHKKASFPQPTKEDLMASAVPVAKVGPAVDLKYEIGAKPATGQPVEIELAVLPKTSMDSLELEAKGMPGLDVVTGGTAAFQNVVGGQPYTAKLLVEPKADGLYYVSVTVKLISKVQTESRVFSVPLVVGTGTTATTPAAPAAPSTQAAPASGAPAKK